MRLRQILSAKLHHVTVTAADINYIGSITVDQDLLDLADMVPGEFVHIWNVTNGERLQTYTISGERGTGMICMNGPAALRCQVGHKLIVASFVLTDEPEAVHPKVVLVDSQNRFTRFADGGQGQIAPGESSE
jgi:aspartate 1-decarboxylase